MFINLLVGFAEQPFYANYPDDDRIRNIVPIITINVPKIVLTRKPYSAATKHKQAKNRFKNWFFFNQLNKYIWIPGLTPLYIFAFTLFA